MSEFKILDFKDKYKGVMVFNKNKNAKIHRWYPFVEGYSKEFIVGILDELDYTPTHCLEPFAGSGTTGLELQHKNIKCTSFEVSPFMHLLSKVKMRNDYTTRTLNKYIQQLQEDLRNIPDNIFDFIKIPVKRKITSIDESEEKVNYSKSVMEGICDIKKAIYNIADKKYKNLFLIALGSILPSVGNLYRNGKCMSYKKVFPDYSREDVHEIFINKLKNDITEDVEYIGKLKKDGIKYSNGRNIILGDVRKNLLRLENNSCDLIITSPPYLNSRDYTDTYMMELWILDLVKDYKDVRDLRKKTIRSHVQIKWETPKLLENELLSDVMKELSVNEDSYWNESIPNMILSYFKDMDIIFNEFSRVMKKNSAIYWNVANSAYFGVKIPTDEITAQIAETHGFKVIEFREAREVRTSSQQKDVVGKLRESVIVMKKSDV